jgi:hypothetical protein
MIYLLTFTVLYGLFPLLLVFYTNSWGKIKFILPFIIVVFLASLYEFFGSLIFKINVEYWFLIYGILAFFSIHYFFYFLLKRRFKKIFLTLVFIFFIFFLFSIFYGFSFSYLNISSFFKVYQTIIILSFSILWFKSVFEDLEIINLLHYSIFYFISGLLIYYCGSVFLFLSASSIYASDKSNFQYYWLLNIILNLVLRTLMIIGIWKARQE